MITVEKSFVESTKRVLKEMIDRDCGDKPVKTLYKWCPRCAKVTCFERVWLDWFQRFTEFCTEH